MAEKTGIAWTRSTFNSWIGCTRVGPGCDHCYAEALDDKRFSKTLGAGTTERPVSHWGVGAPRHRTSASLWGQPLKWNRAAAHEQATGKVLAQSEWKGQPGFWPVFCCSLADVFDNEVPQEWRDDLWRLIRATPNLTWQLLTKRIGNVEKMHPGGEYLNVWIGASIVNQEEADRDITKLLAVRGVAKLFISYEPALGPVNFKAHLFFAGRATPDGPSPRIDQIIVGGESSQGGAKARPFDLEWARSTVRQCKTASVACFVKQLGSHPLDVPPGKRLPFEPPGMKWKLLLRDRAGADPAEWPADLRVQCFPE